MNIKELSVEKLKEYQQEIDVELKKRNLLNNIPKLKVDINEENKELISVCEVVLNRIIKNGFEDTSIDSVEVYEKSMKMLYGEDIFEWIDSYQKLH